MRVRGFACPGSIPEFTEIRVEMGMGTADSLRNDNKKSKSNDKNLGKIYGDY